MPFLHPPTFRNQIRQASFLRYPTGKTTSNSQDRHILLLGVLTLTARFHPDLIAYHSQPCSQATDPLVASEYYATALTSAFKLPGRDLANPSLERIQALLMLGLYEWSQKRGVMAWICVGTAIRLAQSLGLPNEDDPDHSVYMTSPGRAPGKSGTNISEDLIQKEIRRRTLWSCLIMDRMLAAGSWPTMIQVEKLRVHLPCSDNQFLFVHNTQTSFLSSDWFGNSISDQAKSTANNDGGLSRYLRLVEIFSRLSDWSCAKGQRTEKLPPWNRSTEILRLRQQLKDFQAALPSILTYSEANLSAHVEKSDATTYVSIHILYSLCLIMLHKESIPFIPLRCQKPPGSLDEPTIPEEKFDIPEGFGEHSAEELFKAARNVVDIVRNCQDNNALPESPQIGFAVWQAALVCLYAAHFPHMDPGHYLLGQPLQTVQMHRDFLDKSHVSLAMKILKEISLRSEMAKSYLKLLVKIHHCFQGVKISYCDRFARKSLGWIGGGLEQIEMLEKELEDFGSLQETERNIPDESDTFDQTSFPVSGSDIESVSSVNVALTQGIVAAPASQLHGTWAPTSVTHPSVKAEDWPNVSQGTACYPYIIDNQQFPCQSSDSSLVSPNHGDFAPCVDYHYAGLQGQPLSSLQPNATYSHLPFHCLPRLVHNGTAQQAHWNAWMEGYGDIPRLYELSRIASECTSFLSLAHSVSD